MERFTFFGHNFVFYCILMRIKKKWLNLLILNVSILKIPLLYSILDKLLESHSNEHTLWNIKCRINDSIYLNMNNKYNFWTF